jgi:hypothetical protein
MLYYSTYRKSVGAVLLYLYTVLPVSGSLDNFVEKDQTFYIAEDVT